LSSKYISDNVLTGKQSSFLSSFYGLGKISILDYANLSGGLRYINNLGRNSISAGAKLSINFGIPQNKKSIFFDISKSDRFPNFVQGLSLENRAPHI
jgi:hypothetical protein